MRRFLLIEICLGVDLVAFCVAVITTVDERKPSRRAMPSRSQAASSPPTPAERVHQVLVL